MERICEERLCTGCSACGQICPQGAIRMNGNEEGFLYPEIDGSLCNDCGFCAGTCPVNRACKAAGQASVSTPGSIEHKVYACYSKDPDVRSKSSSGGVFTQLALHTLSKNGVVFGAGFDEAFRVTHKSVDNMDGLDDLRRSKYVQSNPASTFREARAYLREGRSVLYCGTPCQIAGLKAFLGKDYDSLLTCDLACHGVPSPKVWGMFLDFLKQKFKSDIRSVSFRDKSTGWNNSSMVVGFENGNRYSDPVKKEIFFIGFGKSIFNRRSCYDCKFRIDTTKADITLADFWGIDRQGGSKNGNQNDGYRDNMGVSLIITHTAAGERAMSEISGSIRMEQRDLEEAVRYNPRLVSSITEPVGRRSFFADLASGQDFDRLRRKYMDNFSLKYRAKILAKRILGRG